jgi:5-methylcytosine-specific restriction endonuclease McrA
MLTSNQFFQNVSQQQKVKISPQVLAIQHTEQELKNIQIALEYMRLCKFHFKDKQEGLAQVNAIVADQNQMISPVWPGVDTLQDCFMLCQQFADISSDWAYLEYTEVFAKGNHVAVRAVGGLTHDLAPFKNVEPSGKKITWSEADIFVIENGKLKTWYLEMDRHGPFKELGFPEEA